MGRREILVSNRAPFAGATFGRTPVLDVQHLGVVEQTALDGAPITVAFEGVEPAPYDHGETYSG